MSHLGLIFSIFLLFNKDVLFANGALEQVFVRCCAYGVNWAREGKTCKDFQSSVPGEAIEHQSICITSASICCLRYYRENQCQKGKQAAIAGAQCLASSETGGEFQKDCCHGCTLGMITGSMGMQCQLQDFSFGYPWANAFQECCQRASPVPTLSGGNINPDSNQEETEYPHYDQIEDHIIPDSENLCHLFPGQLCGHVCIPTKGSFKCECRVGFTLALDQISCIQDVRQDRCKLNNPCDHICHDTGISIECSCNVGYQLDTDQRSCKDVDECSLGIHQCNALNQYCYNRVGSYVCVNSDGSLSSPGTPWTNSLPGVEQQRNVNQQVSQFDASESRKQGFCPPGYRYNLQTRACDDVDECSLAYGVCGQEFKCENTIGSFTCVPTLPTNCPNGFAFDVLLHSCIDVDECTLGTHQCPANEFCLNIQGSYECQSRGRPTDCPAGYKYNEQNEACEDVNECEEQLHSCLPEEEVCRNVIGAYECNLNCGLGFYFRPQSRSCVDINECLEDTNICNGIDEVCINVIGSFRCQTISENDVLLSNEEETPLGSASNALPKVTMTTPVVEECPAGYGFELDSRQCLDVDECARGIANCLPGQICVNTEGAFTCKIECRDGFRYIPSDPTICVDIDECLETPTVCNPSERCLNTEGSFQCVKSPSTEIPTEIESSTLPPSCSAGYRREGASHCTDIDECKEGTHNCQETLDNCVNLPGSYSCVRKPCPPGFVRNEVNEQCEDVDECENLPCRPDEECVNTPGRYICRLRPPCKAGFRREGNTQECVDIDECVEYSPCPSVSRCINTNGSYTCKSLDCHPGYHIDPRTSRCQDVDECQSGQHACNATTEICVNNIGSYKCKNIPPCPDGFKRDPNNARCVDVDECTDGSSDCVEGEVCVNQYGGYKCRGYPSTCGGGYRYNPKTRRCLDIDECDEDRFACSNTETCLNTVGSFRCIPSSEPDDERCGSGFKYDPDRLDCIDIDECKEGVFVCEENREVCVNEIGGYRCEHRTTPTTTTTTTTTTTYRSRFPPSPQCPQGYNYNNNRRSCIDIDECESEKCDANERCVNTPGSYKCACHDGYTRNGATGDCTDVNECQLGMHTCTSTQRCDNTLGSYTCTRMSGCGTGYTLNHNTGSCEDINECEEGQSTCKANEQCVNYQGYFRCFPKINCARGYEMDEEGNKCVDIDECEKKLDQCTGGQKCINRQGGYVCQCPPGYRMDQSRACQDIDECRSYFGSICGSNGICENTPGSYVCNCNSGFKKSSTAETCVDINECTDKTSGCEQNCVNSWGTFYCTCNRGFKLAENNRSCTDIDECDTFRGRGRLCIGLCINTPGTFKCECPKGYRLQPDQKTCKDIDECEEVGTCRGPNETCVNTRGSYECQTIECPPNYVRDANSRNRCEKALPCKEDDLACFQAPLKYSYNFIPLPSNMTLGPHGEVDLFTMSGPAWSNSKIHFSLALHTTEAPSRIEVATEDHFLLKRTDYNQVVLTLVKSLEGPQQVTLNLNMQLYHGGFYKGSAVSKIILLVSQYDF